MQYKHHEGLKLKPETDLIKEHNTSYILIFWLHFSANVNVCIMTSLWAIYGIIVKRDEKRIDIN
jgi:hypothetical protein